MSSAPMSQKQSSSTRPRSRSATAPSTAAASRRRWRTNKLARVRMTKRRRLGGATYSSSSSSSASSDVVSEKLEALKNLIPVTRDGGDDAVATDELFQETADYILLLRTQVVVLQKLIHFYGSADHPEKQRQINDASSVL